MNSSIARNEMTSPVRIAIAFLLAIVVGATLANAAEPGEASMPAERHQMIVETSGDVEAVRDFVGDVGGEVIDELPIIEALVITAPSSSARILQAHPDVTRVTSDGRVQFLSANEQAGWADAASIGTYSPATYGGSMYWVAQEITGAGEFWNDGHIGTGVGVALIDSGAVPVNGLTYPGKIVNGPDLSLESQVADRHYLDTMGHGTHMAGIIAGRDDGATVVQKGDSTNFLGMAPGAHVVSIKVADYEGSTDVSQVIAAVDWVVEHRNDPGLNIRVLNLSFGTDGVQSRMLDPLAFAVERAWDKGIVVVVAAGNDGAGVKLRNPAMDPFVISVGATDSQMTYSAVDDVVPSFSSCGTVWRHVDLVAPGQSIVSLRNPGSMADIEHPEARVGQRFFLGSGTSQAAAVVSGAAALVIGQRPGITPDEVKALLTQTAQPIPGAGPLCQGAGVLDLKVARDTATPANGDQNYWWSTGAGSLDAARGTHKLVARVPSTDAATGGGNGDGTGAVPTLVVLEGEIDIFGQPFDSAHHAVESILGIAWQGGTWNGSVWSGSSWSGSSWSGSSWSGSSWSGSSWSGSSWSGSSWSGSSWSGNEWSKGPLRWRIPVLAQRIR